MNSLAHYFFFNFIIENILESYKSGSQFPIGRTVVNVVAQDEAGLSTSHNFSITVEGRFTQKEKKKKLQHKTKIHPHLNQNNKVGDKKTQVTSEIMKNTIF